MQKVDLHIHSCFSDGDLTPKQLIEFLEEKNYLLTAITDHDTIEGYKNITSSLPNYKIKVLSGVEFSSMIYGEDVHLLGYGFDVKNKRVNELLEFNRIKRLERLDRFIEKFKEIGIRLEKNKLLSKVAQPVGRPHIAKALVDGGFCDNYENAFRKYLLKKNPTYVKKVAASSCDVIEAINKANGVSVVAHPFRILDKRILPKLIDSGIMGIETYYASHSKRNIRYFSEITQKYGLVDTGGTDFHRFLNPRLKNNFGGFKLPNGVMEKLLNCLKMIYS